jgi:hypothetical protein
MSTLLSSESSESVVDDLAMNADNKCVLVQSVKTDVNPCAVDWRGERLLVSAYEYLEGWSPRRVGGVTMFQYLEEERLREVCTVDLGLEQQAEAAALCVHLGLRLLGIVLYIQEGHKE